MSGKTSQSKLEPFENEIFALLQEGVSYRRIAEMLDERHGLQVTRSGVGSYVKATSRKQPRRFDDGLVSDLRESLRRQLIAAWTHDSTAIDGNTLTLGETNRVLSLGVTIKGKPLGDHEEIKRHARAIDLIITLADQRRLEQEQLLELHCAAMPEGSVDTENPLAAWRRGDTGRGRQNFLQHSPPPDIPALIETWLEQFNQHLLRSTTQKSALAAYSWTHLTFLRIQPFSDGNARLARLLSNLPVLAAAQPPIVISAARRAQYQNILLRHQWAAGQLTKGQPFLPDHRTITEFRAFIRKEWQTSIDMLADARNRPAKRSQGRVESIPRTGNK